MDLHSKLKVALGISLLPFVFTLFMVDRLLTVLFFWKELPSVGAWSSSGTKMAMSIIRILTASVFYVAFQLIKSMF